MKQSTAAACLLLLLCCSGLAHGQRLLNRLGGVRVSHTPAHLAACLPARLPLVAAGNWLDGVEQSLLYCARHPIDEYTGQALFNLPTAPGKKRRDYRLLREDLCKAAHRHYAQQHPHLKTSRALLAGV